MTLTITDCGDEWTYDEYKLSRYHDDGLAVEVTGTVEDLPWMYARTVLVTVDAPGVDVEYEGHVSCPEVSMSSAEEMKTTAIISESWFYRDD